MFESVAKFALPSQLSSHSKRKSDISSIISCYTLDSPLSEVVFKDTWYTHKREMLCFTYMHDDSPNIYYWMPVFCLESTFGA